jgi:hypothetical protein
MSVRPIFNLILKIIIELVYCWDLSIYPITGINSFKIKINKGASKQVRNRFKMFFERACRCYELKKCCMTIQHLF